MLKSLLEYLSGRVRAVFMSGREFVSGRVWAVFVSRRVWTVFVSGRVRVVFMSGQEFVSGHVQKVFVSGRLGSVRVRAGLSPDLSGWCLSLDGVETALLIEFIIM